MKTSQSLSKIIYLFAFIFLISLSANAQLLVEKEKYGRADSLRGYLSPMRTCYDINYYHLDLKIDIDKKAISGSNEFKFTATRDFTKLQFDLFANFKIEKVVYQGKPLTFKREINAVFVNFPLVKKGNKNSFTVYYSGNPTIAKRAPWDGGFVFSKDAAGKPFIATACQGVGASIWWPNKDHQADEVDSMLISISVPKGLKDISNGRLRKTTELKDGYTCFDWFVANPINNYDVALNVGDFVHFDDVYEGEKGKLTLDYWVLPENLEKAKVQFAANVKPMLKSFEYWFGPYPFYEDGYKLVESPHLGMEHQSAVAYGNKYQNGYLGRDMSTTGVGLKWDFIIVHESGHEWFGNNITSKDLADMWIHESFTNYSESLFTESMFGKQAGQEYIEGTRKAIQNQAPVQGIYNVNREGSGDMYPKGGNLLNMVRTIIDDDEKWRSILRGLNKEFYHSTVNAEDVIGYINKQSGKDFTKVFDQYLKYTNLPILEIRVLDGKASARWIADVKGFDMPVRLKVKGGDFKFYNLTTVFKPIELAGATKDNIEVDFNYYIGKLVY
ncbi:M1 family metallopeptidase [Pedobacter frigiditerrae]|uniref:M1 family metallopeptidase n=1 Tax=Pedobacter frigiditerrae TaxID=2530452 RepID=UPI00292DDDCE|nr:M1 family metallopeptidase [Pedobacter frigiditerrae]